jgi:hypothetical protein
MCKCGCDSCGVNTTPLMLNESLAPKQILSEGLKHHMDNNKPLTEHLYRAGSTNYFNLWAEARSLYSREILEITNEDDLAVLTETNLGHFGMFEGKKVPLDFPIELTEAEIYEGFLKDLVWAVKSDVGNAIMGNSSPGRVLYNQWKSGELYKDEKSPYSKKVSWYDEGAIKTKAQEYDKADKVTGAALKKVSDIKKKFGTKINTEELGKNKEYLTAYIDYLTKEAQSLVKLHELRLALGMREKSNPYGLSVPVYDDEGNYKGESVDKELLLKKFPKEWVDEMDMDKPIQISALVGEYKEKIQAAKDQLSKLSESINEAKKVPLDFPMLDEGTYEEGGEDDRKYALLKVRPENYNLMIDKLQDMNINHTRHSGTEGVIKVFTNNIPDKVLYRLTHDVWVDKFVLKEAKNDNKPIGKPMRDTSGGKAYKVYVKDPKTKKIKTVRFGSGGLRAKINDKEARNAFAARHKCSTKKDKTKAGYWSCRLPRYAKLLGLKSSFTGFW